MKFSLILATLNRTGEVDYLLKTLDRQTYRNFELIVVDQNADDRLVPILEPYQNSFPILHLRSAKGLSLARNVALPRISGDLVAFPDDDCAYPAALLEQVVHFFKDHTEWNGLIGRAIDEQGTDSSGRWDHETGAINALNAWRRGTSFTIFLRRSTVDAIGLFDESLGVGAQTPWGSGEDIDYLLRGVKAGLYYDPAFTVIHPITVILPEAVLSPPVKSTISHTKTYTYAMGRGRVLRKHNAPLWFVIYNWTRPLAGVTLSLLRGRLQEARSHWATFQGRVQGWLGWAKMDVSS